MENLEVTGACLAVNDAHQQEQQGRDQAMAHHLKHGPEQGHRCAGGRRQQHIAHVAHRAERDHALHVGLGDGGQRAVEHRDRSPDGQCRRQAGPGFGKQLQPEAQQPVGTQLEQNPRQDHRHRCRGLGVGIG